MTVPSPQPSPIAVPDGIDAGIAWHYGDPLGEQRHLMSGAGVIDRANRGVLAVSGPDRLPWLHSIITQHVSDLTDGQSTQALVLSPNGHVEQHWQLSELGGSVWIDVEPAGACAALAYLDKMRFLKRVEPLDVSVEWSVVTLAGPTAPAVLAAAGLAVPALGLAVALPGGGFVRGMPAGPAGRSVMYDLIVDRAQAPAIFGALGVAGAQPVGLWAFEALRVQARRPRLGFETDHRTIPHEVGWIGSAVHLDKGCYRGQETVARVQNLGKPPRRLVLVYLDGLSDVLPAAGTAIEFNARVVGFLGTAVQHYELGPVALAVVKRTLADDAALTVNGQALAIDTDPVPAPSD